MGAGIESATRMMILVPVPPGEQAKGATAAPLAIPGSGFLFYWHCSKPRAKRHAPGAAELVPR